MNSWKLTAIVIGAFLAGSIFQFLGGYTFMWVELGEIMANIHGKIGYGR